jgi:DNA helicase-2/ATP-dependent DNA helicase PcrA
VYRLAWAALTGCEEASVRAAFHYVQAGRTLEPETLPGATELAELLESAQDRQTLSA